MSRVFVSGERRVGADWATLPLVGAARRERQASRRHALVLAIVAAFLVGLLLGLAV